MLNKIFEGVCNLEDLMCECAEINSFLFTHNKMYMISTNSIYETPEYNHQPYTFKYGDYSLSDYIKQFT